MGAGTSSGKASSGGVFKPKYTDLGPLKKMNTASAPLSVGDKATVTMADGTTQTFTAVNGRSANMTSGVAWREDGSNNYFDGSSYTLANRFKSGIKGVRIKRAK